MKKIDVSLKFPCFLYNPANVGNLIFGSSSFSKPSLDIWMFLVCIMLKSSMQDFKHDLSRSSWDTSAIVQWLSHCLVLTFLGIGMRIDLFQSYGHCWVFQICWHNECKALMASSFKQSQIYLGSFLKSVKNSKAFVSDVCLNKMKGYCLRNLKIGHSYVYHPSLRNRLLPAP